ncbi:MAG: HlyC/CorC family transporter [Dehalococcoidia bacterium]|nr:HlyC/CorC family transporter [Dehalococcoidia bacterium]
MHLDTRLLIPIIPTAVLLGSAALLVLLSAAEAASIHLTRRRLAREDSSGLSSLLRAYVSQRQALLRALRTGVTGTTVAATLAAVSLATGTFTLTEVVAAAAVVGGVGTLRAAARRAARFDPEPVARRLDGPIRVLQAVLTPLAVLFALPVVLPLRALGRRNPGDEIDPAEELIGLLEATDQEDDAMLEERRMMRAVLELSNHTARELMTPRTDVTAIPVHATFGEAMKVAASTGFSRIPLYEETLDRVVGVVYAKDLLGYVSSGNVTPRLVDVARPPYLVPETRRADELLTDMRRERVHLAIVVDEYGGTSGVITVEDLIEEIVGEITDEYDAPATEVEQISPAEAIVDGSLTIDELNHLFEAEIVAGDFDTVGGLIVTSLGRLAVPGDEVVARALDPDGEDDNVPHLEFRVLTILGRRIKRVRVLRLPPGAAVNSAAVEAI